MEKNKVRILKISADALAEFIYRKISESKDAYLDISRGDISDSFAFDKSRGQFIYCAYSKDKKFPEDINLCRLMDNFPDTTESMLSDSKKYREYTFDDLKILSDNAASVKRNEIRAESSSDKKPEPPIRAAAYQTIPQFIGYDKAGKPEFMFVQMKLAGYDKNRNPFYVPVRITKGSASVQQVTVQAASSSGKPETRPTPKPPAAPVQPAAMQVNISKIGGGTKPMPRVIADAVASSQETKDETVFDRQNKGVQKEVLDIEDALCTIDDSVKRKKATEVNAVPLYEEYKMPEKTSVNEKKPDESKPVQADTTERPLTKQEAKAKKRQEKIDSKFRKKLAKKGY